MIECQDVSFSYPASTLPDSERQAGGALKHISCTIEDGSFVLLCGTSGCGKTTMTRLFNGLITMRGLIPAPSIWMERIPVTCHCLIFL